MKKRFNILLACLIAFCSLSAPLLCSANALDDITKRKNICNINDMLRDNIFIKVNDCYNLMQNNHSKSGFSPFSIPKNTVFTVSFDIVSYCFLEPNEIILNIGFSDNSNTIEFVAEPSIPQLKIGNRFEQNYSLDFDCIGIVFYMPPTNEYGNYVTFKNFQIEFGNIATEYEEYFSFTDKISSSLLDTIETWLVGVGNSFKTFVTEFMFTDGSLNIYGYFTFAIVGILTIGGLLWLLL